MLNDGVSICIVNSEHFHLRRKKITQQNRNSINLSERAFEFGWKKGGKSYTHTHKHTLFDEFQFTKRTIRQFNSRPNMIVT